MRAVATMGGAPRDHTAGSSTSCAVRPGRESTCIPPLPKARPFCSRAMASAWVELRRPAAELSPIVGAPALGHQSDALAWLEGPQQDRGPLSLRLADDVAAEVPTHGEVHVQVAGRAEHDRVARRRAAVRVARRVVAAVGLDLDQAAADAAEQKEATDKIGCDFKHRAREEGARQRHAGVAVARATGRRAHRGDCTRQRVSVRVRDGRGPHA